MRKRKRVYLDIQFWEEFKKKQPELKEVTNTSVQIMQCWISFLSFLSKSDLHINISPQQFLQFQKADRFLSRLWKKTCDGECGLEVSINNFPNISDNRIENIDDYILNSIILIDKSKSICEILSNRYGILVMNVKMALGYFQLFKDNGIALPNENNIDDWHFLSGIPFINVNNSVLIVDNFIFKNAPHSIDDNIIPILDCILPQQLDDNISCDITIYTYVKDRDGNVNVDAAMSLCETIKGRGNNIKINIIDVAEIRRGRNGNYLVNKYFHDRAIITNHLWIGSGRGFDVFPFDTDEDKSTTINIIYPHFQSTINWAEKSYTNIIETAKKVNGDDHHYENDYWGDESMCNRLIDEI